MSYTGQMSYRGRGIFAAAGLGVAATTTTTGGKTAAATPDRTAADWTAGIAAVGPLVGSLFGAATGTATTPAVTEEVIDPATASAPASSAGPSWYWPVVIGVGVAVLGGIGYMSYGVKAPVRSNSRRKRRLRRNISYQYDQSHPSSYDSHGRPRRNSRKRHLKRGGSKHRAIMHFKTRKGAERERRIFAKMGMKALRISRVDPTAAHPWTSWALHG
jgi:hypothetical protein